ncbi:ascorbate-specific permease IIC component UlaA (plasmid) [Carnobacterium sp. 17-4]|uniref:PTS ascorbate transporter subunit IIC n=1 Tax=Carnobacterium sp. (strain 17-4) TaxID=208596 RepID=UPI0002058489|nr:PTS ascorbate transporter subunit IIC [Carnobacterium sp. 17-4]AEB31187.1 ascorbate-specific permease IIC component UlaA [Carnobacterium sp. 17-4]
MWFIAENILKNPPVLLGIIAMIGLIIQRKTFSEVVKGTLTAAFGMVILTAGVNMLVGTIAPINAAVQSQLGVEVTEGLSDITFTAEYGGTVGLAMFVGLIIHLLIARFTPVKTIFLTGHMLWWFPFVFVAAGVEAGLSGLLLIVVAAVLSACYWSFMPWIMRKYVWDATGDESFLIGHPTGILSLISGFVAKRVGNKEKSTEDINVPENLSFFREISITGGLVLFLMNLVMGIIAPGLIPEDGSLILFSIEAGLNFGAGLLVMLYGVRLLINQIVPAFQGIAEKVVPGAKPAFDVPILFNYKPNAVIIGFIVAMITSTIVVIIADSFNIFGVLIVPLIITSFFECGGAAVIGEGQGGLRGAIIGTAVASIVMVVLVGLSAVVFSSTIQNWILIFGGNDLSLWGILGRGISELLGGF